MPILLNISQLATCPPDNPQHDAGLIRDAALVWRGREIVWAGPRHQLPDSFSNEPATDCGAGLVVPGLLDCHTHLCFGGWRADEFERRLKGASYQEIRQAGGGIARTVAATRGTSMALLLRKTSDILDQMLALGITTVECKSGYGLDHDNEIKQLQVYRRLQAEHAIDLVPTFLGAHVIPPEYAAKRQAYVDFLCRVMIPELVDQDLARFCDIFVEEGAFSPDEARQVLAAARQFGMGIKIHADQLSDGGGAQLAAEMAATSAEHLEYISDAGISALAAAGVVAVSLPLASLYLKERYLPARKLLDAGVRVAVATDFNPGSAPSFHLPLALTLACLYQGMTPSEVLMGATTVAARALRLEQQRGCLAPGFDADITIIDAPDLSHWLYHFQPNACRAVIKQGQWVHPTADSRLRQPPIT